MGNESQDLVYQDMDMKGPLKRLECWRRALQLVELGRSDSTRGYGIGLTRTTELNQQVSVL